ncbi:MAG: glycosyltransferase [Halobacteriota archaeon]
MSEQRPPTVLMLPDYTRRNPYQRELRAGLEREGVGVAVAPVHPWFPVVRGWVRHGRPDVVHLHWITPYIDTERWWLALLLGLRTVIELVLVRILGTRVVWTVHNLASHEDRTPRVDYAVRFTVIRLCSTAIVHCERARELVREHFRLSSARAERVHPIPHGHYLESYPDRVTRDEARRSLEIGSDEDVLLYFGLIRPYKNVPGLIDAFQTADVGPDTRLLVVGNPQSSQLRERILASAADDPRIEPVLEFVPDASIQTYMRATDAVVLPFRSVLTSGSAVLAMSFDRAVILPDRGCPAEIVGDAGGIRYDDDRPEGLVRAIEMGVSSATDLDGMGRRNRRAVERFDWDDIAARTADVYRGVAHRTDRPGSPAMTDVEATRE